MILSTLISDIILRVYQGKPSDDSELSRSQILHWLVTNRDQIVKEYLDSLIKAGKPLDTYYATRETGETTSVEDLPDTEDEDERIYLQLTNTPMTLLNDLGVFRVISEDGVMVEKARSESIDWVKDLKWGAPSVKRPVYYREDKKIILEGLSYQNLDETFIVYYIPTASSQSLTEASDLLISGELIDILLTKVETMAKAEILGTQSDLENDGTEVTSK
jgi:hypothetical protein